jgi:hypothetical protein
LLSPIVITGIEPSASSQVYARRGPTLQEEALEDEADVPQAEKAACGV